MAVSISPEEQVRFIGILREIEGHAGGISPASSLAMIPYSTYHALSQKGTRPAMDHAWGLARALTAVLDRIVTPEQVVARIRGVEIPSGKRAKPLVEQVADAPLYLQIECFEVLSELLIKRLETKTP